jgi:hypothetical protein
MENYVRSEVSGEDIQFKKRLVKGPINNDAGGDNWHRDKCIRVLFYFRGARNF